MPSKIDVTKTKKNKNRKGKSQKNPTSEQLKITHENKCSLCVDSKCCSYTTQYIDTPSTMREFDFLLWQISHPHIQAYKDQTGWYLIIVDVPCSHLLPDGACGIYEKRPMICREHSNAKCEFDRNPVESVDLYFKGYEDLDVYCRTRFKKWDKRFKKWLKDT
jgi:Fe-S-cluster containining protein